MAAERDRTASRVVFTMVSSDAYPKGALSTSFETIGICGWGEICDIVVCSRWGYVCLVGGSVLYTLGTSPSSTI